jgi:arylsulfatase A
MKRNLTICLLFCFTVAVGQSRPPNIVFIIADDLGRNDLSCYGNRYIETPNLDRIAKLAVRYTRAYAAAPVCSPTRASILTGQYPARIGLTNFIDGRRTDPGSPVNPADYINYLPYAVTTFRRSGVSAGTPRFSKR